MNETPALTAMEAATIQLSALSIAANNGDSLRTAEAYASFAMTGQLPDNSGANRLSDAEAAPAPGCTGPQMVSITSEAAHEALSALYSCRNVLGNAGLDGESVSLAISLLERDMPYDPTDIANEPSDGDNGGLYKADTNDRRRPWVRPEVTRATVRRSSEKRAMDAHLRGELGERSRSANDYQPGGDHYRRGQMQHWDFVQLSGMGYLPGCASKYVSRCRFKHRSPLGDLNKALHYVHKAKESGVGPAPKRSTFLLMDFAVSAKLNTIEIAAIWAMMDADWPGAQDAIESMVKADAHAQ